MTRRGVRARVVRIGKHHNQHSPRLLSARLARGLRKKLFFEGHAQLRAEVVPRRRRRMLAVGASSRCCVAVAKSLPPLKSSGGGQLSGGANFKKAVILEDRESRFPWRAETVGKLSTKMTLWARFSSGRDPRIPAGDERSPPMRATQKSMVPPKGGVGGQLSGGANFQVKGVKITSNNPPTTLQRDTPPSRQPSQLQRLPVTSPNVRLLPAIIHRLFLRGDRVG